MSITKNSLKFFHHIREMMLYFSSMDPELNEEHIAFSQVHRQRYLCSLTTCHSATYFKNLAPFEQDMWLYQFERHHDIVVERRDAIFTASRLEKFETLTEIDFVLIFDEHKGPILWNDLWESEDWIVFFPTLTVIEQAKLFRWYNGKHCSFFERIPTYTFALDVPLDELAI